MNETQRTPKELLLRIQSAVILGALVLFALFYHEDSFCMLLIIAGIFALREWRNLNPQRVLIFTLITALYTLVAIVSLWWLRQHSLPLMIGEGPSPTYVLALFITVWGADIAGYAFGKWIGGPKCWPRISPGKTWAGTIAALIIGTTAGAAFLVDLSGIQVWSAALAITFATTIAAIAGDALESYLKRKAGVKDSGKLLPGHGGLLDRIDALLAAAPVFAGGVYIYFYVLTQA